MAYHVGPAAYQAQPWGAPPAGPVGAWEFDLTSGALSWTDGVYDLFGLPRGVQVLREAAVQMYQDGCRQRMEQLRAEAIRHGSGFVMDARIRDARGVECWMRLTAGVMRAEGQAVRLFGSKQDITQERLSWDRLRQRADCDPLTGLANRAVFDVLCHELARGRREDVSALAVVDLDHFKRINDELGHAAGDECLRQLAERLRWALGDTVLVARIGGDEFVVMLGGPMGRVRLWRRLAAALPVLCQPVLHGGRAIDLSVSIGATLRRGGDEGQTIFAEADAALYRAKAAGRNRICLHGGEMERHRMQEQPGWAMGAR
jgi:diguanylate cyclase (GGDEF)-like protein